MKNKIGVIVRSVGERTEKLCCKSLELTTDIPEGNIIITKGFSPFLETLKQCYKVIREHDFDWCLLVDADMVMVKNWQKLFFNTLRIMETKDRLWEFTFRLKDKIEGRNIDALHVVKGAFSKELLESADRVADGLKPEGKIRDDLMKRTGAKRVITKDVIAYHGYEQYVKDIFNRFYNRACRDPLYAKKFKIFDKFDTEDKRIAKAGWDYGIKFRNLESLDSSRKITDMTKFGFKERSHIRFNLNTFYKRVE